MECINIMIEICFNNECGRVRIGDYGVNNF